VLNDALAQTALSSRYWVWGGMLLGWAREGRILAHDADADFAFFREDLDSFRSAIPSLAQAGFELNHAFVNNDGRMTEYVFYKDHLKFEFFETDRQGDHCRYWSFYPPDRLEMTGLVLWDGLSKFDFLGRTWLKPADHEAHLAATYGDWRTPRSDYNYVTDEKSIVARCRWERNIVWDPESEENH
jgi:phosphorylcholine metabolism protein LicD